MDIGQWAMRDDPGKEPEPRYHLVESTISDAAITKCGRRLEPDVDGHGLVVLDDPPQTKRCRRCEP